MKIHEAGVFKDWTKSKAGAELIRKDFCFDYEYLPTEGLWIGQMLPKKAIELMKYNAILKENVSAIEAEALIMILEDVST